MPVPGSFVHNVLTFNRPGGNGYVVDCLHSARADLAEETYQCVVRAAVRFGSDTDTTARVAGGLAGVRWGASAIPAAWRRGLRGENCTGRCSTGCWGACSRAFTTVKATAAGDDMSAGGRSGLMCLTCASGTGNRSLNTSPGCGR
jgi:hypothetical protein